MADTENIENIHYLSIKPHATLYLLNVNPYIALNKVERQHV